MYGEVSKEELRSTQQIFWTRHTVHSVSNTGRFECLTQYICENQNLSSITFSSPFPHFFLKVRKRVYMSSPLVVIELHREPNPFLDPRIMQNKSDLPQFLCLLILGMPFMRESEKWMVGRVFLVINLMIGDSVWVTDTKKTKAILSPTGDKPVIRK